LDGHNEVATEAGMEEGMEAEVTAVAAMEAGCPTAAATLLEARSPVGPAIARQVTAVFLSPARV
jgi:hypothetical protein